MTESSDVIAASVREFIVSSRKLRDLSLDQNIFEQRLVSSMFVLQIISFLEKKYDFTVDDDDLEITNFANVRAISLFIRRKTGERPQPAEQERS
jgi:acyl carrier protein